MTEQPRVWGIRLLALGIAVGIWFNTSVKDRLVSSERVVEAGVRYNRPRGFVILDPVQSVNVRLSGSERAIRQLNPSQIDVQVELSQRQEGTVTVNLGPEDILVPEGLSVVWIEPSTLRMELERELTQRARVLPRLSGEPAAGATLHRIEVIPDTVLVTGPASVLRRLEEVATEAVSLDGHALPFEETVSVLTPNPLIQILQPSKVTVKVELDPPRIPGSGTQRRKEGS
jgi:YbbR domain-containing protein